MKMKLAEERSRWRSDVLSTNMVTAGTASVGLRSRWDETRNTYYNKHIYCRVAKVLENSG